MSGGIDSAVAAALLKKAGHECIGVYLHFWGDPLCVRRAGEKLPGNKCCSEESLEAARKTAKILGIKFYVLNVENLFKKEVVDYFLDVYKKGFTPNPCIECNRSIKFGILLEQSFKMGADFLAAGHYARISKNKKSGEYELCRGRDKIKDQSYFLYTLNQAKLKHILFPIGDFVKADVRKMAQKFGLGFLKERKESQDICFFPEKSPFEFLRRHLGLKYFNKGPIVTLDNRIIGEHDGLPLYTIGQRKGIKVGGAKEPWYVVKTDRRRNALVVGRKDDVFRNSLEARNVNFISARIPRKKMEISARIRYRSEPQKAVLSVRKADGKIRAKIEFDKPVWGASAGQSVVFYEGERVLGGGRIG